MRQDLSEGAFNHPDLTVPKYHPLSVLMDEPSQHTQSRQSPYCHQAELEAQESKEDMVVSLLGGHP
jgi:hypothetical protein